MPLREQVELLPNAVQDARNILRVIARQRLVFGQCPVQFAQDAADSL